MQGEVGWDTIFPTPASVKETAAFWLRNLDRFNGRRWWPRPVEIKVEVDASGVGFGGIITSEASGQVPFTGTFTTEQATQSSTAREMRGYEAALAAAAHRFPDQVKGTSVLIIGDNQGAISALNNLRSSVPEIHGTLQKVFNVCAQADCDVVARWTPRENISAADELSRQPDASDWGISKPLFNQVCAWFGVTPTLDLFASSANHVTQKFMAQFYTPGCTAVHAFKQDWSRFLGAADVAWVFPPIRSISQVISLLERYQVNALICMPVRVETNEAIQLKALQQVSISEPFMLPKVADSCIPSCRVPSGTQNPAFLGLGIYLLKWH
jgi:hypothetical protein